MDIKAEKAALLEQLEQVEDPELIRAIKNMLDYGLKKQKTDPAFISSLKRALEQSDKEEGRPHKDVKQDFRNRYPA
ncbi:MAG: hypothetical protein ACLFUB_08975 [Cyclobacteriaceae bacterium]